MTLSPAASGAQGWRLQVPMAVAGRVRSTAESTLQTTAVGELAAACLAVFLMPRAAGGSALQTGRCTAVDVCTHTHTQEAFPRIISFLRNHYKVPTRFYFLFLTITNVQILIYFWCRWHKYF